MTPIPFVQLSRHYDTTTRCACCSGLCKRLSRSTKCKCLRLNDPTIMSYWLAQRQKSYALHVTPCHSFYTCIFHSSCSSTQGSLDGLGTRVGQGDQWQDSKDSSGSEEKKESDGEWKEEFTSSSSSEEEERASAKHSISYKIIKGRENRNKVRDMARFAPDDAVVDNHSDAGSMLKHAGDGITIRSKRNEDDPRKHQTSNVPQRSRAELDSHRDNEKQLHAANSSKKFSFDQIKVPSIQKERVRFACNETGEMFDQTFFVCFLINTSYY